MLPRGTPETQSATIEDILAAPRAVLLGHPGTGKSTALRCLNRMNDLVDGFRFEGSVRYHGVDIYGADVDPVSLARPVPG